MTKQNPLWIKVYFNNFEILRFCDRRKRLRCFILNSIFTSKFFSLIFLLFDEKRLILGGGGKITSCSGCKNSCRRLQVRSSQSVKTSWTWESRNSCVLIPLLTLISLSARQRGWDEINYYGVEFSIVPPWFRSPVILIFNRTCSLNWRKMVFAVWHVFKRFEERLLAFEGLLIVVKSALIDRPSRPAELRQHR